MSGNLCEQCTGTCCRYVALPIQTPDSPSEFDDIRWYLIHENVSVFVEDDTWYISFHTPCRHLLPDHRCGIYATRPRICRKYTTESCDYHSGDYGWEVHLTSPEHLDDYLRATRARNGRGKATDQSGNGRRVRRQSGTDRYGVRLPRLPSMP